jgi:hypothetical protein
MIRRIRWAHLFFCFVPNTEELVAVFTPIFPVRDLQSSMMPWFNVLVTVKSIIRDQRVDALQTCNRQLHTYQ